MSVSITPFRVVCSVIRYGNVVYSSNKSNNIKPTLITYNNMGTTLNINEDSESRSQWDIGSENNVFVYVNVYKDPFSASLYANGLDISLGNATRFAGPNLVGRMKVALLPEYQE
jgi:hypothetical protein